MLRIPRCERRPHHLNPRAPFPRDSPHLVRAALPGGEIDPPPIARERGEPLIADSARHARRENTFRRDEIHVRTAPYRRRKRQELAVERPGSGTHELRIEER